MLQMLTKPTDEYKKKQPNVAQRNERLVECLWIDTIVASIWADTHHFMLLELTRDKCSKHKMFELPKLVLC